MMFPSGTWCRARGDRNRGNRTSILGGGGVYSVLDGVGSESLFLDDQAEKETQ